MKRDLLSIDDLSCREIEQIYEESARLKRRLRGRKAHLALEGKVVGLLFEKPSTRTRISFEVGVYQLGGQTIFMNFNDLQLGRGETISDSARVLSRYLDCIVIRCAKHSDLEEFARNATIPVINGLSQLHHPCQILADIFTIKEKLGRYRGVKVAYIGDGNNVANSWLIGASMLGINLSMATPEGYGPNAEALKKALTLKNDSGAALELTHDPYKAASGADVIYTDVWVSMGMEAQRDQRLKDFAPYQLNEELLKASGTKPIVMHCMPAHRGQEITSSVMDGERSVILDQAENRLHTQKGLLTFLLA